MSSSSPHRVLGVSPNATPDEIKAAYRRLARQLHPDKTGGDLIAEEKLKAVNCAYEALQAQAAHLGKKSGWRSEGKSGYESEVEDVFASIFKSARAAPVELEVPVSFEQSVSGARMRVMFSRNQVCLACLSQGRFGTKSASCRECGGSGRQVLADEVEWDIPAGAADGDTISARTAEGNPVRGRLRVKESPVWRRSNLDLFLEVPIPVNDLALGAPISVASPYAKLALSLPEGFSLNAPLRLSGQGLRSATGDRGHLWVTVIAETLRAGKPGPRAMAYRKWLEEWTPSA